MERDNYQEHKARQLILHRCSKWQRIHPAGYQEHVRVDKCVQCGRYRDVNVRGESGQIIPLGFDAKTGAVIFGGGFAKGK